MNRVLNSIFNTKKYARSIANNTPYELSQRFIKIYNSKASSLQNNKRSLIIVPGYSVDNPPRIGHHLYYINALKFDPITNPLGYHRIYLFDIYSKKDGRCNFLWPPYYFHREMQRGTGNLTKRCNVNSITHTPITEIT